MAYFPLCVDLSGKPCLVFGGGRIALAKVKKLLEFGPCVRVISLEFLDELVKLEKENEGLSLEPNTAFEYVVDDAYLVIDATGDRDVGEYLYEICLKKKIPLNVVDVPSLCTFTFPAIHTQGDLTVAVSSGGKSPLMSAWVKNEIAKFLPDDLEEKLDKMSAARKEAKVLYGSQAKRHEFLQNEFEKINSSPTVYLVGAGCVSADLITVRGLRIIQRADVIVYDDLIDEALLDEARVDAKIIYVGKRAGKHSLKQEEINSLLIELAGKYKTICRLKGGDPFVFGRGGEEALAIAAAGVRCEEVPGVSSAIVRPALAGIPVTHRGFSRSFHVITGHRRSEDGATGLPSLAEMKNLAALDGTLIFLMGLSNLPQIVEGLTLGGMDKSTPAAVLGSENIRATLGDIVEKSQGVLAPAVIVVGGTAGMNLWK